MQFIPPPLYGTLAVRVLSLCMPQAWYHRCGAKSDFALSKRTKSPVHDTVTYVCMCTYVSLDPPTSKQIGIAASRFHLFSPLFLSPSLSFFFFLSSFSIGVFHFCRIGNSSQPGLEIGAKRRCNRGKAVFFSWHKVTD